MLCWDCAFVLLWRPCALNSVVVDCFTSVFFNSCCFWSLDRGSLSVCLWQHHCLISFYPHSPLTRLTELCLFYAGAAQISKTSKTKITVVSKSNHVDSTESHHAPKHEETNNRHVAPDDKRRPRVGELILPAHAKVDDSKPSPTNSVSSTLSNNSRVSTSSSRSNEVEEDGHRKPNRRRINYVAPTFTRRLSSTQVLEGEGFGWTNLKVLASCYFI